MNLIPIRQNLSQEEAPKHLTRAQFFVFAAFLTAIGGCCMLPFDTIFASPKFHSNLPGDAVRFITLSELFAHGFGVVLVGFGIRALTPEKSRFIPRVVCCALWPAIIAQLLKVFVSRWRPICYFGPDSKTFFPNHISQTFKGILPNHQWNTHYLDQSFPSAHTATVWGLASGLGYIFPRGQSFFFGIAVLASLQRIISHSHWPSDVFFGAAIGLFFGTAITWNWGIGGLLRRWELSSSDSKAQNNENVDPKSESFAKSA
ncbi:MAG: phosphatase PAP2 family protein [Planctomycetota bacterium]